MSVESIIEERVNEVIAKYKAGFRLNGSPMSERDETFFRNGIANGIVIAGLGLTNTNCDAILNPNKNEDNK